MELLEGNDKAWIIQPAIPYLTIAYDTLNHFLKQFNVKYRDQLVHSVTPFLNVLGYDVKKDLSTPSESLARMVRIARENILPEINDSERKADKKKELIVKRHHKRDLIKI